jgi:hypothetical protein
MDDSLRKLLDARLITGQTAYEVYHVKSKFTTTRMLLDIKHVRWLMNSSVVANHRRGGRTHARIAKQRPSGLLMLRLKITSLVHSGPIL